MESMLEILSNCLKDSNLETISKAELRKKYLEKTGLTKLPKQDKKLFSSAVNTAYVNYLNETKAVSIDDNKKIEKTSDNEMKEIGEDGEVTMDSSDDDITPENINESDVADQFTNGIKDIKMEYATDSDENSLASYKKVIKKSSDGFERQRGKRILTSSSEDETFEIKTNKRKKVLKERKSSGNSEAERNTKEKVSKNVKSENCFKMALVESSDSEDEPLIAFQKKSNSMPFECLFKDSKEQLSIAIDSDDEPIMTSAKKRNSINGSRNNLSDSEDEPIMTSAKKKISINSSRNNLSDSEDEPIITSAKKKISINGSRNNSSDSNEPHTKYKKCNDSIHSDEKSDSFSNKSFKSVRSASESEDESVLTLNKNKPNLLNESNVSKNSSSQSENESLAKYSKKKVKNPIDSDELVPTLTKMSDSLNDLLKSPKNLSDSEDEPLGKLNNKKAGNVNDSEKESVNKIVDSNDDGNLSKQKKGKSFDKHKSLLSDSSEDEPLTKIIKKEAKVKASEDEPNKKLRNKTDNSSDSEKKPVKKIMKEKEKHSLKKPKTNSKSKEQTVIKRTKKRFVDSDDDASNEEDEKCFDGEKNSLLSDSSEDEPLSNITKKEPKSSSDSEDEPLNKLSTKKSDKKRKSFESGSSSNVDENEEHSSKINKPLKRKEANDSAKGKKHPSASENKIEHLKKYVRVAGIRIRNYNKLFESCKTMKAKCEKLMSLLEKEGLKGRPTLEKCKKLRKKIETKREIAELDMSNILKVEGGRPKRSVCSDSTNYKPEEKNSTPIKKFSRLQDIVDSEESD